MDDARWLSSLEERARDRLPAALFEYVAQGARDGDAAARAVRAWREVTLHPHVLRDVSVVDTSVDLLGRRHPIPFGVAPSTLQRAVHPEGEVAMARAVAAAGGLLVVSSNAGSTFADIGATGVRWWVQCYLPADRELAVPLLQRAVQAGADAVVLTVDTPVVGTKYPASGTPIWEVVDPALLRVNFDPGYDDEPGAEKALDLGPGDLAWLTDVTGLPVVVKGVLRADAARACVDAGAAAVWVSNHGGRQLDRAPTTAAALRPVVEAVAEQVPVYVDGGIRGGADLVVALALGAGAVFLGRQPLYALADGAAGVARMHVDLLAEVVEHLRLCGTPSVRDTHTLVLRDGPTTL